VVLLPVILFFIRSQIENHYISKWDGMKKNVAELDAIQQKIHRYRPWFTSAPQGLQVIEDLVSAFPDQGDVWAKSVQLEQGDKTSKSSPGSEGYKVTCAGFARNEAARLAFLDRLRQKPGVSALQVQQLRGDTPVQFSFTYQWEQSHEK
jgi:Tfp pilus assembly protein PilN